MFKALYYKADGKKGRARQLPAALFDGVVNEPVLHRVVKAQLANKRQGTASAKNRAVVAGGARKPWRQKGTGRARQGTIRAVQWEGGGRAFPPIPHAWNQKVPRKVKALARRSALNSRAESERVVLIDALSFDAPKTARLREYLRSIDVEGKILMLTHGHKDEVYLSARNMPGVEVRPFGEESVYDILWAHTLVIEREAVDALEAGPAPAAADEAEGDGAEPEAADGEPETAAEGEEDGDA